MATNQLLGSCKCNRGYALCGCGCHEKTFICRYCCKHGGRCDHCGNCLRACECPKCGSCGRGVTRDELCDHNWCNRCCGQCTTDALYDHHPLVFWAGSLSLPKAHTPDEAYAILTRERSLDLRALRVNKSRRSVATEIEVAFLDPKKRFGRPIMALRNKLHEWACPVVNDTSLPPGGFEINAAPACGDALIAELSDLGGILAEVGGGVTERCGLHVHVDTRDFMYRDIQRLAQLYAACEWALFASCTNWRVDPGNHYCTPCGNKILNFAAEKKESKAAIIKSIYGAGSTIARDTGRVIHGKKAFQRPVLERLAGNRRGNIAENRNRYWALNLHSWFMRGTVECRMRQGTVDSREMVMWARLWASLVDFAAAISQSNLDALLTDIEPYDLQVSPQKHLAAAVAGVSMGAAADKRSKVGAVAILKGMRVLSRILPKDVFQWYEAEVVKYSTQ